MSFKLKYAKEDKTLNSGGWILDYTYLEQIQNELYGLSDESLHAEKEIIEAVLLVANEETELLKRMVKELEDF